MLGDRLSVFEKTDNGDWTFTHNPFSAPKPEFMKDLMDKKNIPEILTTQYDIVLNGWEIGGGSIRNHTPGGARESFRNNGIRIGEDKKQFRAYARGIGFRRVPHGGIAWGLDRFAMILKTSRISAKSSHSRRPATAGNLMMDGPSDVSEEQLKELRIKIDKKK